MTPVTHNVNTGAISQGATLTDCPAPSRGTPRAGGAATSWLQRYVTQSPTAAKTPAFSRLVGDSVHRQETCQPLPEVDRDHKKEVHLYNQLPILFRHHYHHTLPWLQRVVQNARHPFTDPLPGPLLESLVVHDERKAAVLSYHTLENMRLTPRYCPVEVLVSNFPKDQILHFGNCSSTLLVCNAKGYTSFVDQDLTGSWTQGIMDLRKKRTMKSSGLYFTGAEMHVSIFGFSNTGNKITVLKRSDAGWMPIHSQRLETANDFVISPSGQYVVLLSEAGGIDHIRVFSQTSERWQSMSLNKSFGCEASIQRVIFSPLQGQLAIEYPRRLVMLSQDREGCWSCVWDITPQQNISYAQFCPSGRWLLIAFEGNEQDDSGSVVVVKLGRDGEYWRKQVITEQFLKLTFSPTGAYLFSQQGAGQCWRLIESGQWQFYGELAGNVAPLWPELGHLNLQADTITFSSCDNYLLTSTQDGLVHIWGRDEQDKWTVRGSAQHNSKISHVKFSLSGVHALTVDESTIRIWGCSDSGLWTVKGSIHATRVKDVHFHPVSEHLIVHQNSYGVRIWELRKDDSG